MKRITTIVHEENPIIQGLQARLLVLWQRQGFFDNANI